VGVTSPGHMAKAPHVARLYVEKKYLGPENWSLKPDSAMQAFSADCECDALTHLSINV
jgi:hypothetical protein